MKASAHFGRIAITLVTVALTMAAVLAQKPTSEIQDKRTEKTTDETDRALVNLIAEARQAKPEIEADVLLTLLSSTLIKSKEQRLELIEETFRIGPKAREPIKRKSWSLLVARRLVACGQLNFHGAAAGDSAIDHVATLPPLRTLRIGKLY